MKDPSTNPPRTTDMPSGAAEDDLHAWVDGRLGDAARESVDEQLSSDMQARATADAWAAQRDQLRALHLNIDDAMPAGLLAAARSADAVRARAARSWRFAGLAASVLLAFSLGWLGRAAWPPAIGTGSSGINAANGGISALENAHEFARDAAIAHAVYTPEVRHAVEVGAAQQEHLVQWLSKRLGQQLKVPMLQQRGFELVGGRLLPGEGGARAQFMFQNAAGTRLTLYIGAVAEESADASAKETAFRFMQDGGVPRFYWVDEGTGYALSGNLPRAGLLDVADDVYRQLIAVARKNAGSNDGMSGTGASNPTNPAAPPAPAPASPAPR